jgi:hypothetical protein
MVDPAPTVLKLPTDMVFGTRTYSYRWAAKVFLVGIALNASRTTIDSTWRIHGFELGESGSLRRFGYYDEMCTFAAKDPCDPDKTTRSLTLMLAVKCRAPVGAPFLFASLATTERIRVSIHSSFSE